MKGYEALLFYDNHSQIDHDTVESDSQIRKPREAWNFLSAPGLTPRDPLGISRHLSGQAVCGKNRKNAAGKPV
jgi:hypothetical protein